MCDSLLNKGKDSIETAVILTTKVCGRFAVSNQGVNTEL
jgi:hypothetical protein